MSQRFGSGLVTLIAVGAGDGGAVANALTAFTMPTAGKKLVIRRIAWTNNIGVNANLLIGFGDRTIAGSLFRLVSPLILMINGITDEWIDPPIMGNTPEGFMPDGTVPTGTTGSILVETDGAAGAGNAVRVVMEVEDI